MGRLRLLKVASLLCLSAILFFALQPAWSQQVTAAVGGITTSQGKRNIQFALKFYL